MPWLIPLTGSDSNSRPKTASSSSEVKLVIAAFPPPRNLWPRATSPGHMVSQADALGRVSLRNPGMEKARFGFALWHLLSQLCDHQQLNQLL